MIELFADQQEALDKVLAAYHKQPVGGKALVVAATGWGKTIFFSALIHALHTPLQGVHVPVLIICHREELLNQAREKYLFFDPQAHIGKVGGGIHQYGAPITVAGIDTISGERHLKNLHKFGYKLVIWDECHHSVASNFQKVRTSLPDAFHLGVTATPDRLDGKSLEPLFGLPVFSMTVIEAIQKQRLCRVKGIAIRTETNLDEVSSRKNRDGEIDFNQDELAAIVDNPERNKRVVESVIERASDRRAGLVFATSIKHAESLAYTFKDYGIPAAVVQGNTSHAERLRLYEALRTGHLKELCNVLVLTEGFDLPLIDHVVMARPTQSRALYTQCVGRGMRLYPGKHDCLIVDLTDNSLIHRLTPPQHLSKMLDVPMQDGEDILDALEREENAQAERDAQAKRKLIRKLNERRNKDIEFDPFALPEWEERDNGLFVMVVGEEKHRIALCPCKGMDGLYTVQARLAPNFSAGQKWSGPQPLDGAMQFAEKRARLLLADRTAKKLLDKNEPWRNEPISEGLKKWLDWKKIPWTPEMTKGEACDLRDEWERNSEEKKAAKAARQAAKLERMEA